MKMYEVGLQSKAWQDVQNLWEYLLKRSPQGANTWLSCFENTKEELQNDPQRHQIAPENEFVEQVIRHLVFKTRRGLPYRILFTIVGNEVRILRVRGPGQDLLTDISTNDSSK